MAEIINGKIVSAILRSEVADQTNEFKSKYLRSPGLAVVVVGDDPASAVYVRNKHKACLEVGIESFQISFPSDITEDELRKKIEDHCSYRNSQDHSCKSK